MILALLVSVFVLIASPLPYAVEDSPPLRKAPVTLALVVINTVLFVATHVTAHGLVEPVALFNDYGLVPAEIKPSALITYMFLHISGAHVLWNMVFLYLFGVLVEERVGSVLFAALYLLGGVAAGLVDTAIVMHFAANSTAAYLPVVGASGAISGIIGLFTVFASRRALKMFWTLGLLVGQDWHLLEIPAGFGVSIWLVQTLYGAAMSLIHTDAGGVAYFTHLGGFLFGMALGYLGGLTQKPWRSDRAVEPQREQVEPDQNNGLVSLLSRSLEERDVERATALYRKCRMVGADVPPELVEQLSALSGRVEQK